MALVTLVLLVMSVAAKRLDSGDQVAMNSVDDSDSVEERSGWDPGWVEENPKEVSEENWESWPEWEEIEKEHPAMTGLKNDKVNYKEAGEDLVELSQEIVNETGKIRCTKDQKAIIDTTGQCVQYAAGFVMTISPLFGPAMPFVFSIAFGVNIAMSIMMGITEGKDKSFEYDLSSLDSHVKQHFAGMGWNFQLVIMSLKKVQMTIDRLAHQMTKMLNKVLAKLSGMEQRLISLRLQPSMSHMNMLALIHQDLLRAISTKGDIVEVLQPSIPRVVDIEVRMRADFKENLETLAECAACGGKAAATLWLTKTLNARAQAWSILYVYRMLTNNLSRAFLMNQHFLDDMKDWPKFYEATGLVPWLRLRATELSRYMISAEEHVALESKAEDLKSESWERREEAVQQLLTRFRPESVAIVVEHLIPLLDPPPAAWISKSRSDWVESPEQKACRKAAALLAQVGYPAAWQAKEALERVKDITWRLVTWTSGARTSLSPCAEMSRGTLALLEQQELDARSE